MIWCLLKTYWHISVWQEVRVTTEFKIPGWYPDEEAQGHHQEASKMVDKMILLILTDEDGLAVDKYGIASSINLRQWHFKICYYILSQFMGAIACAPRYIKKILKIFREVPQQDTKGNRKTRTVCVTWCYLHWHMDKHVDSFPITSFEMMKTFQG